MKIEGEDQVNVQVRNLVVIVRLRWMLHTLQEELDKGAAEVSFGKQNLSSMIKETLIKLKVINNLNQEIQITDSSF